jgi:hypothetical protein
MTALRTFRNKQCQTIAVIVSRAAHFYRELIGLKNELLTIHQDKPTCRTNQITTLAPILVIIIAAIVYHLYQVDELWFVASPTHSNHYRSIP